MFVSSDSCVLPRPLQLAKAVKEISRDINIGVDAEPNNSTRRRAVSDVWACTASHLVGRRVWAKCGVAEIRAFVGVNDRCASQ